MYKDWHDTWDAVAIDILEKPKIENEKYNG